MSDISNSTLPVDRLLFPAEVAAILQVSLKTVARWAEAGKLSAIKTLGGHRRYKQSEVLALLESSRAERTEEIPMSDEKPNSGGSIKDALAFREALFSTGLDKPEGKAETVVIETVEPDPFEGLKSIEKMPGVVLVSIFFPGTGLIDAHKVIVNTYAFAERKEAEKRKRLLLKESREYYPESLHIVRINTLYSGGTGTWGDDRR